MQLNRKTSGYCEFYGEDGGKLLVRRDNRGDPFRDGFSFDIMDGYDNVVGVFLEEEEAKALRVMLNERFPIGGHR